MSATTEVIFRDPAEAQRREAERVRAARYVVVLGRSSLLLGIYDDVRTDGLRAKIEPADGYVIDLRLCGIPTLADAIRECDAAAERWHPAADGAEHPYLGYRPYVAELPIRTRPIPHGRGGMLQMYDPALTRVYTTAVEWPSWAEG